MRFKRLIATIFVIAFLGPLIFMGVSGTNDASPVTSGTSQANNTLLQGLSPMVIALTHDGQYAFLSFDLSETIFKVQLANLTVVAVADLVDYFPIQCHIMALDASETKLFAYIPTYQKLIVIDTQTMTVIHTIGNITLADLIRSQTGHNLLGSSGGGRVYFINTDTYEVTYLEDNGIYFVKIKESTLDPNKWFVASVPPPWTAATVGIYDYKNKTWSKSASVSLQDDNGQREGLFDLEVLPNEQKLYLAAFGGWYPELHSFGRLHSISLVGGMDQKVISIDGGAMTLKSSIDGKWLYVGAGWPLPNDKNILVVNTQSDNITDYVHLGQTIYGWPYTQVNNLQIDPIHPNILYATITDANSFIKIDLDSLSLLNKTVLNSESFAPRLFVKQPNQNNGLVLIKQSSCAFQFDFEKEAIDKMVEFPMVRSGMWGYDVAIDDAGRMFVVQGESILEFNSTNMSLLGNHPLTNNAGVWSLMLSHDQKELYSIYQEPTNETLNRDIFLAIDASTFQVKACLKLGGGNYNDKPFELPDGSKLYALGGLQNGAVVVNVIGTNNFTIQKTIIFNETD
jgi:hypothetical protein